MARCGDRAAFPRAVVVGAAAVPPIDRPVGALASGSESTRSKGLSPHLGQSSPRPVSGDARLDFASARSVSHHLLPKDRSSCQPSRAFSPADGHPSRAFSPADGHPSRAFSTADGHPSRAFSPANPRAAVRHPSRAFSRVDHLRRDNILPVTDHARSGVVRTEFFPSPELAAEFAARFCSNKKHLDAQGRHRYSYGFAGAAILYLPTTAVAMAMCEVETPELRSRRHLDCAHVMMIVNESGRLSVPGGTPEIQDQEVAATENKTKTAPPTLSVTKIIPWLDSTGAKTAQREVKEETNCSLTLSRELTYAFSQVELFPMGRSGHQFTCHIGHVHSHVVASRPSFDEFLQSFDASQTDEAFGVVGVPLFHSVGLPPPENKFARPKIYGLSKIIGPEGGIRVPLAGETSNPSRGHDVLLLAYLHGVLDVSQLAIVARAANIPSWDHFVLQLSRFAETRALVARRIAVAQAPGLTFAQTTHSALAIEAPVALASTSALASTKEPAVASALALIKDPAAGSALALIKDPAAASALALIKDPAAASALALTKELVPETEESKPAMFLSPAATGPFPVHFTGVLDRAAAPVSTTGSKLRIPKPPTQPFPSEVDEVLNGVNPLVV